MDLNQFLQERQSRWKRLDQLLDKVDQIGLRDLPPESVDELFKLYRLVSSDLNLVQTRTANPAMIEFLEKLVGRAYSYLVVPRRANPFRAWWHIMRHRFPSIIRSEWKLLLIATIAMMSGALFAGILTMVEPDSKYIFLAPFAGHLEQTPSERVAEKEEIEQGGGEMNANTQVSFGTMLFTHNIKVMVLYFAFGLTFGVGTVVFAFYNGTILGSLAYWYFADGVGVFFVAWIGPHGSIELPCLVFSATAGLMLARCQIRVEGGSTWQQIKQIRHKLVDIIIGLATLLVIAGIIEGGFSQIDEPTIAYWFKILVAASIFTGLLAYLFIMPTKPQWDNEQL